MWLKRKISPKNRISIPQDVMEQTLLKVGDTIYIDIANINGFPTIMIKGDKKYENRRIFYRDIIKYIDSYMPYICFSSINPNINIIYCIYYNI